MKHYRTYSYDIFDTCLNEKKIKAQRIEAYTKNRHHD